MIIISFSAISLSSIILFSGKIFPLIVYRLLLKISDKFGTSPVFQIRVSKFAFSGLIAKIFSFKFKIVSILLMLIEYTFRLADGKVMIFIGFSRISMCKPEPSSFKLIHHLLMTDPSFPYLFSRKLYAGFENTSKSVFSEASNFNKIFV